MTVSVTTVTDRSFSGTSVTERTLSETEEEESVTEEGSQEEEEEGSNWGSEGWGVHEGYICYYSPAVRAERFHKWVRRNKASPNECLKGEDEIKTWTWGLLVEHLVDVTPASVCWTKLGNSTGEFAKAYVFQIERFYWLLFHEFFTGKIPNLLLNRLIKWQFIFPRSKISTPTQRLKRWDRLTRLTFGKTKTKLISLANRNRCKQCNEPIRMRRKYMQPASNAGKRVRSRHNWFWFCFRLVEKVLRHFEPITFETQMKTVLCVYLRYILGHKAGTRRIKMSKERLSTATPAAELAQLAVSVAFLNIGLSWKTRVEMNSPYWI